MRRSERRGPFVLFFVGLIAPMSRLFTRRVWIGRDNVPARGGVLLAVNHISLVDPLAVAHFVHASGRVPRFMAKSSLFAVPVFGRIFGAARQIPVHRDSTDAGDSLREARAALDAGGAVVIYPEGTVTGDPDLWPMRTRTGVARLALATGVPVIPLTQWGAQDVLGRDGRIHLLSRRTVTIVAGPPVDLGAFAGRDPSAAVLREATDVVMAAIRDRLGQLRGEAPPPGVWDPATGRRDIDGGGSRPLGRTA